MMLSGLVIRSSSMRRKLHNRAVLELVVQGDVNMASSLPHVIIKLLENEVPGASLEENKSIEAHNKVQLKRWLECRGEKVGGKKQILVDRVNQCIKNKRNIVNSIDNGIWYNKKLNANSREVLKTIDVVPPTLPVTGWKKFPSRPIPNNFCYGTIYNHFIVSAVCVSKEGESSDNSDITLEFNTSKPLKKGRIYFKSGHVKNISDNLTKTGHYCIKSEVVASYRDNITYVVLIMLEKDHAKVLDSSCQCVASAMGRCNHIAGLLFALEDYVINFGYELLACTSKLCQWNVGRSNKNPGVITEKNYSDKVEQKAKHDYKPDKEAIYDAEVLNNHLLCEIQLLNKPSKWELLLDYKYSDYQLTENRKCELLINIEQMQSSLNFGFNKPAEVPNTMGQSNNEYWCQIRKLYITASTSKDIYNLKPENVFAKINQILWNSKTFKSKYTEHGIKNEPAAREAYKTVSGCSVNETGLWINPKYTGLACSPDGLVFDPKTCSSGIVEIKCPFVLKDVFPNEISVKFSPTKFILCYCR